MASHRAGVLERNRTRAGGIGPRPLDLGLAGAVLAQLRDDVAHPAVGLEHLARFEAGRELQHRHVGVGVGN